MNHKKYNWIVIGGGISGISIAEILCREQNEVLLIEKNQALASETSKVFHEWLHTGALYTLIPDRMLTTRYLLGAIDDLIEHYNCFDGMNLEKTESGLKVINNGWFNDDPMLFKYRSRKVNPIWELVVAKSVLELDRISKHDWLRRRGGEDFGNLRLFDKKIISQLSKIYSDKSQFYEKDSSDLTMNSRSLITDILEHGIHKGLQIAVNEPVLSLDQGKGGVTVRSKNNVYHSQNVVICSPDLISKFEDLNIKESYAPMAVVEGVEDDVRNFVELDYYYKNCINLIKKGNGLGQVGGISLSDKSKVVDYTDYLIREHKKRNPKIKAIGSYLGIKKELTLKSQNRNYEYHINRSSENIWSIVLGKFTLAFSLAPEFYRRIYKKNPKVQYRIQRSVDKSEYIDTTSWDDVVNKSIKKG